ncbi:MAG: nucleoside-diphosphate sugar epimerase/dehydratase [Flavobacteriales bacterium]|jgi:FlaA1/EpsC-like NDP-sugar epimerase|nr:nucleoside-diphosphate sugar epimerase/dehydratase [Flavobacteriales bacterium]
MLLPSKNVPRWTIFLIDVILTIFSLSIAYFIRFDFINFNKQIWEQEYEVLKFAFPIFILVRILSFIVSKTYAGIIRYTSTQDTKRLFSTITVGTVIFLAISIVKNIFYDAVNFLPLSILIIEYLVTLFLLLTFRVTVKLSYAENQKSNGKKKKVLIYGAGKMGVITKNTLERDLKNKFEVIGFVDDNLNKQGKMIERCPIIGIEKVSQWAKNKSIEHIIIAIKDPFKENKRKIINEALKNKLRVSTVPPVEKWLGDSFSVKQIQKINIEDLLGRDSISLNKENISKEIENKVILVTGAAGSIGSEICRQIIHYKPKKLILLDQAESNLYDLEHEFKSQEFNTNWEIVIGDVTNKSRMVRLFSHFKPNMVYHAAAYKHVPLMELNPSEAISTNVAGTKNLVDLSNKYSIDKFVLISTDKAVNPTSIMGASKRIAEIYAQSFNKNSQTQYITTRFGNVLGSNGSVIPLFKKQIANGGPLTVTDQNITRYFMTIPEACQLVLEAGNMGNGGEIFVFDMGESVKIIDLAKKMIKLSGLDEEDIRIKITGLRPGEKLYEELLSDSENTLPTHHDKILIGKVKEYDFQIIDPKISQLIAEAKNQKNDSLVKKMKDILPEFISKNSDFTKFDT